MDEVVSHNTQNQYNNNGGIINSGVNGIFGSTQGIIGATIGGVIGKRAMTSRQQPPQQPMCQPMGYGGSQGGFNSSYGSSYASPQSAYGLPSQPFGAMPVWKNPELDESWTPGPPPTTPPDHLEDDHEREELAQARKEAE